MGRGIFPALVHDDVPLRVRMRFVRYVAEIDDGPETCWEWPLAAGSHGYGQIGWGANDEARGVVLAHRLSYLIYNGVIPEDMTVDHVCRNRVCVNPTHLRLLTNYDNARDNGMAQRTHCPQGHAYDAANTYVDPEGHRRCIACHLTRKAVA